jgi:Family of unknown function (DUF6082)
VIIATLSLVISSVALLGVACGLILQARQLKANQLQVSRATQLELVKLVIDNPELLARSVDSSNSELKIRINSFLNYRFKRMELSYSIKAVSAASVRLQSELIFNEGYPVEWWAAAREVYAAEAMTRRERQFFALVDEEYTRVKDGRPSLAAESTKAEHGMQLCLRT